MKFNFWILIVIGARAFKLDFSTCFKCIVLHIEKVVVGKSNF